MEPLVKNLRLSLRKLVRELDVTKGVYKSTGYSYTECHILIELDQYGMMTIKELAELLNTDKSIVSKTVNSMMKKDCSKRKRTGPITVRSPSFSRKKEKRSLTSQLRSQRAGYRSALYSQRGGEGHCIERYTVVFKGAE